MTPLEIFEYKHKWLKTCNSIFSIDEYLEYPAKSWCRFNLKPHQWHFSKYTDVYEDTFYFETEELLKRFKMEFVNGISKTC